MKERQKKTPKYEKNCQKWDDRGKKMEKKKLREKEKGKNMKKDYENPEEGK